MPTPPPCPECGFAWDLSHDDAVTIVGASPRWFAKACEGPFRAVPAGTWSPGAYVWHLVDVLRIGAERCWHLQTDRTRPIAPFDQDELAAARSYADLSPAAGLVALQRAAEEWVAAVRATPPTARAPHAELGAMDVAVIGRFAAHEVVHHVMDVRRQRSS